MHKASDNVIKKQVYNPAHRLALLKFKEFYLQNLTLICYNLLFIFIYVKCF